MRGGTIGTRFLQMAPMTQNLTLAKLTHPPWQRPAPHLMVDLLAGFLMIDL